MEKRRRRILCSIDRTPHDFPGAETLSPERIESIRREAEELYWNELSWEQLTDEEAVAGGHMTEMVFPGFLAYVDGLLVDHVPAGAPSPARPHPDAVEEILTFVAERYAAATRELEAGIDSQKVVWARMMSSELVDLVLYRLYRLSPAEVEALEGGD
ncbi:MAG TPA: hypothetical protein VF584_03450 [Longimicrobium sp.]